MYVLINAVSANGPIPTPQASSRLPGRRRTDSNGICGFSTVSSASRNTGLSVTPIRMYRPAASRTMLARNGIRQPHDRRSSSGSMATTATTAVESNEPMGEPICMTPFQKPRLPGSACSVTMRVAPPHSPPIAMPWTTRSNTSSRGAITPTAW